MPDTSTPAPGSEYRYVIGDYALAAVQVLGAGWGGDYGYLGGSGLIWGPGVPTLRLALNAKDNLVLYSRDDTSPTLHPVRLPNGAATDADDLRKVGEMLAQLIVEQYVN
ncbi:hypothetical protein ACFVHW_04265 [Streptomyces sp. NPDC127110]|uniref:hypothetical protein n=1 Tax=Streptomyces sp. NPDC127110 TaxID=3345362 RepID=UPI0036262788